MRDIYILGGLGYLLVLGSESLSGREATTASKRLVCTDHGIVRDDVPGLVLPDRTTIAAPKSWKMARRN